MYGEGDRVEWNPHTDLWFPATVIGSLGVLTQLVLVGGHELLVDATDLRPLVACDG